MIRHTHQAGHALRGRAPKALKQRRRQIRFVDCLAAVGGAAVATVAAHQLIWFAVAIAVVMWVGCVLLAGAHASAALRLRRQAMATIIAAAVLTGACLGLILVLPGHLGFALDFQLSLCL